MQEILSCVLDANLCRIIKTTFPIVFNIEILLVFIFLLNSVHYGLTGTLQIIYNSSKSLHGIT